MLKKTLIAVAVASALTFLGKLIFNAVKDN